jgi:hypothetical protein
MRKSMVAMMLLLSGCVEPSQDSLLAVTGKLYPYACVSTGSPNAGGSASDQTSAAKRALSVEYNLRRNVVILNFDGRTQYLAAVPNEQDRLYANNSYAWKQNGEAAVLTVVAEARTYECARKEIQRGSMPKLTHAADAASIQ